jgi:hypothetical protein
MASSLAPGEVAINTLADLGVLCQFDRTRQILADGLPDVLEGLGLGCVLCVRTATSGIIVRAHWTA